MIKQSAEPMGIELRVTPLGANTDRLTKRTGAATITQIIYWVSPTNPMPINFPIIISNGFAEETNASIIRVDFSSITLHMTCDP